jgi:hypothetical protein
MNAFRIPNGTNVTVGDWIGIVVDMHGPDVWITSPLTEKLGRFFVIQRENIVKNGRSYEVGH